MFELWRLERRRKIAMRRVHEEIRKGVDPDIAYGDDEEARTINDEIEECLGRPLLQKAAKLDIELPKKNYDDDLDEDFWWRSDFYGYLVTKKGRRLLREWIHAEETRRHEKLWWLEKLVFPALLVIFGAVVGAFFDHYILHKN